MLSKAEWALVELAEGIDLEELETRLQIQKEGGETQSDDDDDDEGLEDELAKLTADKQMELSDSICPVRLVLVKVSTSCCHRCEN